MIFNRAFSSIVSVTKKTPEIYTRNMQSPFQQMVMKARFDDVKTVMGSGGDRFDKWGCRIGSRIVLDRGVEHVGQVRRPFCMTNGQIALIDDVAQDIIRIMNDSIPLGGGWGRTLFTVGGSKRSAPVLHAENTAIADYWTIKTIFIIDPRNISGDILRLLEKFEDLWDVKIDGTLSRPRPQ